MSDTQAPDQTDAAQGPDEDFDDAPEQVRVRREKRDRILAAGGEAYPVSVPRTGSLAQLRAGIDALESQVQDAPDDDIAPQLPRLHSQLDHLTAQFTDAAPGAAPDPALSTPNDPALSSDFAAARQPPRASKNKSVRFTDNPDAAAADDDHDPNRAALLSRNSITTLFPDLGPLTSPLSSSLSAIVADSLRRGVDHSNQRSLRPLRRNTTSRGQQAHLASTPESSNQARERHSIASGTLSQEEAEELGQLTRAVTSGGGGNSSRRGQQKSQRAGLRARSLSASLGGLFTRGGGGGNSNGNGGDQGKLRAER